MVIIIRLVNSLGNPYYHYLRRFVSLVWDISLHFYPRPKGILADEEQIHTHTHTHTFLDGLSILNRRKLSVACTLRGSSLKFIKEDWTHASPCWSAG